MVEIREGRIRTGQADTFFLEAGRGEPVILIHGSGPGVSARANWRFALPALADSGRILAPELLGFGSTTTTEPVACDVWLWVDQIARFVEGLGIARCSVVGNSLGGAIALGLAVRHPALVERIVTMGTVGVPFPITSGLDQVWGYTPGLAQMRHLVGLFTWDTRYATDEELVRLRHEASSGDAAARYSALFPAPRQRWVDALAIADVDLATIRVPVLLIHGRDDRIIPWDATSLRMLDLLPDARLLLLPRCGHWVQIERRDEFHAAVRDFLSPARRSGA